jgi:SulP family sulfate permease
VPNAVLAGIVANAVLALIEVDELRSLYRLRRSEFWIAVICLATVLALGPLPAVVIAFLLSAIDVVRRAANPRVGVLQRLPGGRGFYPSRDLENVVSARGLVLFRFGAELFFANANYFQDCVKRIVEKAGAPIRWFVLDAEAISDIDTTGAEALEVIIEYLQKRGITFALARAEPPIPRLLERYRLTEKIDPGRLYITNRDAVEAFLHEMDQSPPGDANESSARGEDGDIDLDESTNT